MRVEVQSGHWGTQWYRALDDQPAVGITAGDVLSPMSNTMHEVADYYHLPAREASRPGETRTIVLWSFGPFGRRSVGPFALDFSRRWVLLLSPPLARK